ncbi:tyrosine-type recombinase/integrase [Aminobacter aminovorans]|uniref:Integrase n=1 Tax=Aminobacter aminovorans TaxID=83263 RepID=A0AAC8YL98_AMIAI|nr:site-specific integrase [Aminobacter aminovorans]AMS40510.1 Integrase family protein [Aminobacter aminovorans]MBB3706557.1 integrase [Aminobacter aminovorans]
MSRTLTEAALSTENARKSLPEGTHWRGLNADVHLGYRKQKRGGKWLVRWYQGEQKYKQETFGTADDGKLLADGVNCFSYEQAKAEAARIVSLARADELASIDGPAPTIRIAVEEYASARDERETAQQRGKRGRGDARQRLTKHVLSAPVANIALHALAELDLVRWRAALPKGLAESTVRRVVNDFKAALNAAAVKYRSRLPAELAVIIKNGFASKFAETPTARDKSALPDGDIRRILIATAAIDTRDGWDGDLLRMVAVLAATGARFSQVSRMMVGDVQLAQSRLMVPTSRKGRGTKKASHIATRVGDDVLETLRPAVAGRRAKDPLLERWRHKQSKGSGSQGPQWVRDKRGPWLNATELTRPWQAIITAAGLPADVVPYALRHSSIVRQLRTGLPVRLVAALHDTSTIMIESHYSAAIIDALDALSAGAVVPLMPPVEDNVRQLRGPVR